MKNNTMKNEHVHCDVEELLRSMGGITQKMLMQRLRELEADGIASRQRRMEGRVKVAEYSLTEWATRVMGIHHRAVRHHDQLVPREAGALEEKDAFLRPLTKPE